MQTPTITEKKKEKANSSSSSTKLNTTLSPGKRDRLRSTSLGNKQPEVKPPVRPTRTQLAKCPCMASNERSWKIKCSFCKQAWHTTCCNLVAKGIDDKVIADMEKQWACPWCYVAPFLRPVSHPSTQVESKLFGSVVAGVISESVATTIEDCLAAKTAELQLLVEKSVTDAVDVSLQKLSSDLKEAVTSSPSTNTPGLPSGTGRIDSAIACPIPRRNPTNHIDDYREAFLTEGEVLATREALSSMEFTKVNGREIASFGEIYSYTGAPSKNNKEIPEHLSKLVEKIQQDEAHQSLGIDQIVVNKYVGIDSFLPEHSDNEKSLKAKSKIITISIGAERNVMFKDKCSGNESGLNVVSGSLYLMTQESQHYWTHRIDKEESVQDVRYSITFRTVGSNNKNGTVILGDSNTKYLKFGTGQGTFGYNFPGERVETFHIKNIDANRCIGYQNVLIHCGINDLRDKSPGREAEDPDPTDVEAHFAHLLQKINEIKELCPYTAISVSPLLPTKNIKLNNRAVKFNSLLFDFLTDDLGSKGVQCLNFSNFVDHGVLKEEFGTWDAQNNCFNKKDILHLGKTGIRLLAKVVKESILNKKVTMRSYSDTLTLDLGVS